MSFSLASYASGLPGLFFTNVLFLFIRIQGSLGSYMTWPRFYNSLISELGLESLSANSWPDVLFLPCARICEPYSTCAQSKGHTGEEGWLRAGLRKGNWAGLCKAWLNCRLRPHDCPLGSAPWGQISLLEFCPVSIVVVWWLLALTVGHIVLRQTLPSCLWQFLLQNSRSYTSDFAVLVLAVILSSLMVAWLPRDLRTPVNFLEASWSSVCVCARTRACVCVRGQYRYILFFMF